MKMKWWQEAIYWALAIVALILLQAGISYVFNLSREQAGWFNAVTFCAIFVGIVVWLRWRR
jgi:hypothetical protein